MADIAKRWREQRLASRGVPFDLLMAREPSRRNIESALVWVRAVRAAEALCDAVLRSAHGHDAPGREWSPLEGCGCLACQATALRARLAALDGEPHYAKAEYRKSAGDLVDSGRGDGISCALDGDCPECLAGVESGDGHNEGCSRRGAVSAPAPTPSEACDLAEFLWDEAGRRDGAALAAENPEQEQAAFAEARMLHRAAAIVRRAAPAVSDEDVARELVFLWSCVVGTEAREPSRRNIESALVWVRAVRAAEARAKEASHVD